QIDVVREIFPGAPDAFDFGLAAEFAFRADFAGHARHFGGERVQLVDHGIDGVLEHGDIVFEVDGDFAGWIAFGHGGGDAGDVADLGGEVAGHRVDAVGEIFPGAPDAFDFGLAAEFAFGADFAGHARHFGGERVQLVDHGIDGVL